MGKRNICILPLWKYAVGYLTLRSAHDLQHPFELPECFFAYSSSITDLFLTSVIVRGNLTIGHPMERLAKSISSSTYSLFMFGVTFLNDAGDLSDIGWEPLSTTLPMLWRLTLQGCKFSPASALPNSLAPSIYELSISFCPLQGGIPDTFFDFFSSVQLTSFSLDLAYNDLDGTIPGALFANFDFSAMLSFSVSIYGQALTGSLPSQLFSQSMPSIDSFTFYVASNGLEGALADIFGPVALSATRDYTLILNFEHNSFNGPLPTWYGTHCWVASRCSISLGSNAFSGALPPSIFPYTLALNTLGLTSFSLSAPSNPLLEGSIPTDWLGIFAISPSISLQTIDIDLSENHLSGSIDHIFSTFNWTSTSSFSLYLSHNLFEGSLPETLWGSAEAAGTNATITAPILYTLSIDLSFNPLLSGSVPSTFLTSLPSTESTPLRFTLDLDHTGLTGTLHIPGFSERSTELLLSAINCRFSYLTFAPDAGASLMSLSISNNPSLNGTLPASLFESPSILNALLASNTSLSGDMPNIASNPSNLTTLLLNGTFIDFCSLPNRAVWVSGELAACILISRIPSVTAYHCAAKYPSACITGLHPSSPTPTLATPSSDSPVVVGCPPATRPSPLFLCNGSTWTYVGNYNQSTLNVPSHSTIVIAGNLTSSSIILNGIGSNIIVEGCASNLSTITVELTPVELERIGKSKTFSQRLLSYNSSDPSCKVSSLDGIKVTGRVVGGSTCKRVRIASSQSNGILSAVFTIDNSKCRVWWIVLVSVVCAVILIGVVVILVVYKLVKGRREEKYKQQLGNIHG